MLVPMVDCVFADVAQPDQGRIVALNSQFFLKNGGNFVISIKVCSLLKWYRMCFMLPLYNASLLPLSVMISLDQNS